MKIISAEMLHVDAGWRPWLFVKVVTDEGVVGWSECTESNGSVRGMEGVMQDLAPHLVGKDPVDVEAIITELHLRTRQSPGSVVQKVIGGIEDALLDIKGKIKGVPVYELFGKPEKNTLPLYWSHCGTSRVRAWQMVNRPQIKTREDVVTFGKEVRASGFKALKTNIAILGETQYVYMPGFFRSPGSRTGEIDETILSGIEEWISALREAVGDDIQIALDLNFNFNTKACIAIGKRLLPYNLGWLEIDMYDPAPLKVVTDALDTSVTSCENVLGLQNYKPFIESRAMDTASIDVIWNGFSESLNIARYAANAGMQVVPHNYNGHLSTIISAHWGLLSPNLKIMEYDVDDVPWRDDLFTTKPHVENGTMTVSKLPGWGCDVNEDVIREHPWPKKN